ncbi:hypothetical protein E2C01_009676 [Portunus trituberculatus]|uniref:Uncharacterized protein n=1 Tax=Portunus trituberculatus TaxID=210409 RepID=A0A5B7D6E1_PORTR|nr:hypothetical protein [Portunus trituberculatus]
MHENVVLMTVAAQLVEGEGEAREPSSTIVCGRSTISPKAEPVTAPSPRKAVHHIIRFHMGTATHSAIQCIPPWFEAGSSEKKLAFQSCMLQSGFSNWKNIYTYDQTTKLQFAAHTALPSPYPSDSFPTLTATTRGPSPHLCKEHLLNTFLYSLLTIRRTTSVFSGHSTEVKYSTYTPDAVHISCILGTGKN